MTSSSLRDRLAEYFMNRHVRRLATAAPFGFDVGLVAGVLGCVVALPGFAASGFGIIAAGLAINRVSSYLDRLAAPALSDEERELILDDGLRQQDAAVRQLVAAALVYAGPTIAETLPDEHRADLIAAIGTGMDAMGGPSAYIAPHFTEALCTPATHWVTTQASLLSMITTVTMTMEATDAGIQRHNRMEVEGATGPISMTMKVTGNALQEGNVQHVRGYSASLPLQPTPGQPPHAPMTSPASGDARYQHLDVPSLEELRAIQRRNMTHLATQAAKHGDMNLPIPIKNAMDEAMHAINAINAELTRRGVVSDDPSPASPLAHIVNYYSGTATHQQTMDVTDRSTINDAQQRHD